MLLLGNQIMFRWLTRFWQTLLISFGNIYWIDETEAYSYFHTQLY